MRVALLVGVLLVDMMIGFYDIGWVDTPTAISEDGGQVSSFEDTFPPPPPPPSYP
jgi:hypothetical protein